MPIGTTPPANDVPSQVVELTSGPSGPVIAVGQREDRKRIATRIRSLARDPRPFGTEKLSERGDLHRLRVGRYRVVYSAGDAELVVLIVPVGHRKDVYR